MANGDLYAILVVGAAAAASVAYAMWAIQWLRWHAPLMALLEFVTYLTWMGFVLVYVLTLATPFDVTLSGPHTVRPLLALLALTSAVKAVLRYRRAYEREATREAVQERLEGIVAEQERKRS